ncbi:hypothetical protein FCOIX_14026 [Fusarium coicis]|nr:hypothetical protein FCOIX_14026 [Fusarium coicis]
MEVVDPRAQLSQSWPYNFNQGPGAPLSTGYSSKEVDIGEVEEDAAQLWGAVLSNDGDWDPTIQGSNGKLMYPLRSIRTVPNGSFTIAQMIMTRSYGVTRSDIGALWVGAFKTGAHSKGLERGSSILPLQTWKVKFLMQANAGYYA